MLLQNHNIMLLYNLSCQIYVMYLSFKHYISAHSLGIYICQPLSNRSIEVLDISSSFHPEQWTVKSSVKRPGEGTKKC